MIKEAGLSFPFLLSLLPMTERADADALASVETAKLPMQVLCCAYGK